MQAFFAERHFIFHRSHLWICSSTRTHKEAPWVDAYDGDNVCGYTNEPITKEAIRDYFKSVYQDFDLRSEDGLKQYIEQKLACYSRSVYNTE